MSELFPVPSRRGTVAIAGTGASRVAPTDEPSARQVIISALQSGTELALILAGTPSADVEAARLELVGSTTDIGTSYLALINDALGSSLLSTDEWDDVATTIDAL